jgi:hypothetical protein
LCTVLVWCCELVTDNAWNEQYKTPIFSPVLSCRNSAVIETKYNWPMEFKFVVMWLILSYSADTDLYLIS